MARSILIVGSGGREHALAWACAASRPGAALYCAPGNGGTDALATNVPIAATDADGLVRFAQDQGIGLVVLGPDAAIAAGVADGCVAAGIPVFGPTAGAGRIESSKEFAKTIMQRAGIPTARWQACDSRDAGMRFVNELGGRCVVKADGLALGKGVTVCDGAEEADNALRACLEERRFGDAGSRVLVEERLDGRELSIFAVTDGVRARMLGAACDYKRARDGDRGSNTGGMGAYLPPLDLDVDAILSDASEQVIGPCLETLHAVGAPFTGVLYAGVIITATGLRVFEYNARFGDPETQALLPLIDEDIVALLEDAASGGLQPGRVALRPAASVTVVAAAEGYPGTPRTGMRVTGMERLDDDVQCFHGGIRAETGGGMVVSGGRVLSVTAQGPDVEHARARAYDNIGRIAFDGIWYRRDIALQRAEVSL